MSKVFSVRVDEEVFLLGESRPGSRRAADLQEALRIGKEAESGRRTQAQLAKALGIRSIYYISVYSTLYRAWKQGGCVLPPKWENLSPNVIYTRFLRGAVRDVAPSTVQKGQESRLSTPVLESEQEKKVSRMLAEGLSNKDIARQLAVDIRTVEQLVQVVLAKLGTPRRATAVKLLQGSVSSGAPQATRDSQTKPVVTGGLALLQEQIESAIKNLAQEGVTITAVRVTNGRPEIDCEYTVRQKLTFKG